MDIDPALEEAAQAAEIEAEGAWLRAAESFPRLVAETDAEEGF